MKVRLANVKPFFSSEKALAMPSPLKLLLDSTFKPRKAGISWEFSISWQTDLSISFFGLLSDYDLSRP
jgi:hypothetical protein